MNGYLFRPAQAYELEAVEALYKAASENPFSVWNQEYPTIEDARHDLETGNLFVLSNGMEIVGTLSIVPEREMDALPCWTLRDGTERELARITVSRNYQGKGLAAVMVEQILAKLKESGCHVVRLSAAVSNLPAWKTYQKLGFQILGEDDLYGSRYYLMEKLL